jgi:hypothetical protein
MTSNVVISNGEGRRATEGIYSVDIRMATPQLRDQKLDSVGRTTVLAFAPAEAIAT